MAVLANGERELIRLVGADRVRQAKAVHQFPNQPRPVARSSWDCYCYPCDGFTVVGSLSEDDVQSAAFQSDEAREIARTWMERLNAGYELWTPPGPLLESPDDWKRCAVGEILSIDFEGWERIERVSLANQINSISLQWGPRTRDWVYSELEAADRILAYNMGFELKLLDQDGFPVRDTIEKWDDPMIAAGILYPWRHKGLGKMAPLFVMMEPFKHLFSEDPSRYSRIDSALLHPIWEACYRRFRKYGGQRAYDLQRSTTLKMWDRPGKLTATYMGVETPLTKAAGCIEWSGHDAHGKDIKRYELFSTLEGIIGAKITIPEICPVPLAARHVLGFGVRSIRNGLKGQKRKWMGPIPKDQLDSFEDTTAARLRMFDEANPQFVAWRDHLHSSNERDRFVQTWSGRRLRNFSNAEAQFGVILSSMAEQVRAMVAKELALPGEINGEYFRL